MNMKNIKYTFLGLVENQMNAVNVGFFFFVSSTLCFTLISAILAIRLRKTRMQLLTLTLASKHFLENVESVGVFPAQVENERYLSMEIEEASKFFPNITGDLNER